jgi:lipid II:glycine glycyltransferase (peptidoglycan interpeptide bridge formation enzyme)
MSSLVTAPDRWTAWDSFLEHTPETGFMQSSYWADFRLAAGFEHFAVIVKSGSAILGGALVQKYSYSPQSCFYYVQDGPVVSNDAGVASEVFDAILADIDEHRTREEQTVSHLRIEPRWQHRPEYVSDFRTCPSDTDFVEPRRTLWVDLRPSEADILAQMKPKGRYNIHVARKHNVSIVEDTSAKGLEDFQAIYEDMASRQDIQPKPPEYFAALISTLSPAGKASILFAEHQNLRVAAAIIIHFGQRATYFFGGSLHARRNVMAPYLLHFEIMRSAKALGLHWYDFWGIASEDDPNDPWQNITMFKRKFGGQEVDFGPTLDYVYNSCAYQAYLEEAQSSDNASGKSDPATGL